MKRFAKIDPATLQDIQARQLDPIAMKMKWLDIADRAEATFERIANDQPDLPIGCAFVDEEFEPHWIEDREGLSTHFASLRGCWPQIVAPG